MNKIHKILSIILIILIALPAIRQPFNVLNDLNGAYIKQDFPKFSYNSWKTLNFQNKTEKCAKDHFGFRPEMVRFANQINYTLFDELNPQGIVIGDSTYLFDINYAMASGGRYFLGTDSLKRLISHINDLQIKLHTNNTKLLVLLAPDKVTYMHEHLPDKYQSQLFSDSSNYYVFRKLLNETDISYIDYNELYLSLKNSAEYPLFPKYGVHWSLYGVTYAVDTLIKTAEHLLNKDMIDYRISELEVTRKPKGTDYDIGKSLNLIFKLPGDSLAYPTYEYDTNGYKPNVLIFGDSYYKTIHGDNEVTHKLFSKNDFLYYKNLYNGCGRTINLPEELKNYDLVIIEATTANIHKIGEWLK